jgi:hypothetical protein
MELVETNLARRNNCIYMHSRNQPNTNDIFEDFFLTFNTYPFIKKCNKANIMEFHFKTCKKNIITIIVTICIIVITQNNANNCNKLYNIK